MSRIIATKGSHLLRRTAWMQQRSAPMILQQEQPLNNTSQNKRWGHTVRLIALEDLPHGKAYKGDVLTVKAGYARNHLVPQKLALYATPQNFKKLGIVDPDFETEEERIARLQRESNMTATEDRYLKEADLLKKYLKNKVVSSALGRMKRRNSSRLFWISFHPMSHSIDCLLLASKFWFLTCILEFVLYFYLPIQAPILEIGGSKQYRRLASGCCYGRQHPTKAFQATQN